MEGERRVGTGAALEEAGEGDWVEGEMGREKGGSLVNDQRN